MPSPHLPQRPPLHPLTRRPLTLEFGVRLRLSAQAWLMLVAGILAIIIVSVEAAPDFIVYNRSSSIPRGFYVRTNVAVTRRAIVTVRAVEVAPDYARLRQFTDLGDRFIKRVVATDGDVVCAEGNVVTVNGARTALRVERDSAGRALPTWQGCRTLQDEVFLLGDTSDSFDGRYWGPTPVRNVESVWRPLGR